MEIRSALAEALSLSLGLIELEALDAKHVVAPHAALRVQQQSDHDFYD